MFGLESESEGGKESGRTPKTQVYYEISIWKDTICLYGSSETWIKSSIGLEIGCRAIMTNGRGVIEVGGWRGR